MNYSRNNIRVATGIFPVLLSLVKEFHLLPGILILTINLALEAQNYEVSGEFKSETYSPQFENGKTPVRVIEGGFSVSVIGCNSLVRYFVTNSVSQSTAFDSFEAGEILAFDGTNYYQILTLDTNRLTITNKLVPSGKISVGPVPERIDNELATLWTAFASHCYFKNADPKLIYSPWMGDPSGGLAWSQDHRVRATWTTSSTSPELPISIVHSSVFVFATGQNAIVESNVVYSVSSVTNLGPFAFPKEFFCHIFWPVGKMQSSFSGTVGYIRTNLPEQNFVPKLPRQSFIVDERFIAQKGNPRPQYIHNSPSWPTLLEGERNLLRPIKATSEPENVSHKKTRVVIFMFFAVSTVAAIIFLRSNNNKNK